MGEVRHHSAYITIHGPGHDGTRLVLREGITSFGRLPSNDVILLGDLVSRHHSRITFFEGRATVQDLGSHNGSWVNGEKVTTRVLKDGDICRVGNFRLSFHPGAPPPGSAPSIGDSASQRSTVESNLETTGSSHSQSARIPSQSVLIQQIERARIGEGVQAKAMNVVLRASEALAAATDIESYMQEMLRLSLEQTGATVAAFLRHDADTRANTVGATRTAERSQKPTIAMSVVDWTVTKNFGVLSDDVASDLRFERDPVKGPLAALSVPVVDGEVVIGAMYLSRSAPPFHDGDLDVLSAIAHLMATALTRARFLTAQTSANTDALSRLSSPDIAKVLREQLDAAVPGGLEGKRATVIVADVPGLSSLSERTSPADITAFLSRYLDGASEIASRYKGALCTINGAKLMFMFGAPVSYGDDASRGIAAALELRALVEQVAPNFASLGQKRLRVGAESGWLLAGPVGTQRRLTYAVLGDTVDVAVRFEQSAAAGAILIGEATAQLVNNHFELRKLGVQQVRGRFDALTLFEVLGPRR